MLVREIAAFGNDMHAAKLIAVTEPAFERFVRRCGLPIQRTAGPIHAGRDERRSVQAVLITFDITPHTLLSVGIAAEAA